MYCAACGNELSDPQQFCPKCGVRLAAELPQVDSLSIEFRTIQDGLNGLVAPLASKLKDLATDKFIPSSHCKSQKIAIYWHKKGPQTVIGQELSDLMIRLMASEGVVTTGETQLQLFKEILCLGDRKLYGCFTIGMMTEVINTNAPLVLSGPYEKPWTLTLLEDYDATNGTNFSDQERTLFMKVASAFVSVNGPISAEKNADIGRVRAVLQGASTPQLEGELPVNPKRTEALASFLQRRQERSAAAAAFDEEIQRLKEEIRRLEAQIAARYVAAAAATDKNDLESLIRDFKAFEELTSPTVNVFLQKTKLIGPDGQPSNWKNFVDILHADLVYLFSNLTKVDGQVSDNRARIFLRLWTALDEQDLPGDLKGELLETVKRATQQQWVQSTGPIVQLSTIVVLQAIDESSSTAFSQQAKSLFLRLASLLTNADGSASAESQSVFQEFEKLLAPPDVSVR